MKKNRSSGLQITHTEHCVHFATSLYLGLFILADMPSCIRLTNKTVNPASDMAQLYPPLVTAEHREKLQNTFFCIVALTSTTEMS